MNKMTNELVNIFLKQFDNTWFKKPPLGLVSDYFPNTFNPSGGHDIAGPTMLKDTQQPIRKFYTVERCFRDIDVGIVGLSHHLSFFEMLTFGIVGFLKEKLSLIEEVVEKMSYLLFNVYNLNRDRVFVAYFSGGEMANLYISPPTEQEIKVWEKNFRLRLIPVPGRRTFIYSVIDNWPAGAGFEIFYDRGEYLPETIRFIEIASINFYKYLNKQGSLKEATNWAIGGGIGLERLSMVIQQAPTIYDIDIFQLLKKSLYARVKREEIMLFQKSYNIVVDHLRAISFILLDGQRVNSTPRGKILRRLIKRTANQLAYINLLDQNAIETFYDSLILSYKNRYPSLENQKEEILNILKKLVVFSKIEKEGNE